MYGPSDEILCAWLSKNLILHCWLSGYSSVRRNRVWTWSQPSLVVVQYDLSTPVCLPQHGVTSASQTKWLCHQTFVSIPSCNSQWYFNTQDAVTYYLLYDGGCHCGSDIPHTWCEFVAAFSMVMETDADRGSVYAWTPWGQRISDAQGFLGHQPRVRLPQQWPLISTPRLLYESTGFNIHHAAENTPPSFPRRILKLVWLLTDRVLMATHTPFLDHTSQVRVTFTNGNTVVAVMDVGLHCASGVHRRIADDLWASVAGAIPCSITSVRTGFGLSNSCITLSNFHSILGLCLCGVFQPHNFVHLLLAAFELRRTL